MDNRVILNFIQKAANRLKLIYLSKTLHIAVFAGLTAGALMLLVSRLFMLPYYEFYAYAAAGILALSWLLLSVRKLPSRQTAVKELDLFTPHNQLLTVWQTDSRNALTEDLENKTEKNISFSYQLFKKQWNQWFHGKWLLASLISGSLLLVLLLFPSTLQQQAKETEKEMQLIEDIIEKVEVTKDRAETETVKKELEELQNALQDSENAEQALQELVKKQKELALQEQQAVEKENAEGEPESEDLQKAAEQLAEQTGETQTALGNMGKPVSFPLQQAIANNESGSSEENSESENTEEPAGSEDGSSSEDSQQSGESSGSEDSESGEQQSEGSGEGEGQGEGQGEGEGEGQGEGEGEGEGEEESQGEGQGEGQEQGEGSGAGQGQSSGSGQGAGTGQGSRDLLTVPSRIGGTGDTEIDKGQLGEGEAAEEQEGEVPAERGSARPYSEVIGSYSESYFTSADRMQLPSDLQEIIEQYFSSIESE